MPSAVAARDPAPEDRFEPAGVSGTIDPQFLPNALDGARIVNVMLEMRGDPVAVVQSKDADKSLTRGAAQRDQG